MKNLIPRRGGGNMKDANTKTAANVPSVRLKRISAFIAYVEAMNNTTDETNDVLLLTDFGLVRYTPSSEHEDSFLSLTAHAIEEAIAGALRPEGADVIEDGSFIVLPKARMRSFGSNAEFNFNDGLILFIDSIKGISVGNLDT